MKKLFIFILTITTFASCKNESKSASTENAEDNIENQKDGLTLLEGDFVYFADAAVIQTKREVYGVVINDIMHKLDDQVKPYKVEATDMIPVVIRGRIIPKPEGEEGWPFRIDIKEIVKVREPDPNKNDVVKLGTENAPKTDTNK